MHRIRLLLTFACVAAALAASCGPASRDHHDHGPIAGGSAQGLVASTGRLLVEVDHVADRTPSAGALALLRQRLLDRGNWSAVDVVLDGKLPRLDRAEPWRLGDLLALEARHRSVATGEGEQAIYVVYVEGQGEPELGHWPLGWAYGPNSIAVFVDQFEDAATLSHGDPEPWVLVHETGHLLGLVGLGAPQQTFHEDLTRMGHCAEAACVMRRAADARHTDFGPRCREDLRAIGGR